jgi:hypothetical protein
MRPHPFSIICGAKACRAQKRAVEIYGEDLPPILDVDLENRGELHRVVDRGVVHEDVRRAQRFANACSELADALRIAHVDRNCDRSAACLFDPLGRG